MQVHVMNQCLRVRGGGGRSESLFDVLEKQPLPLCMTV